MALGMAEACVASVTGTCMLFRMHPLGLGDSSLLAFPSRDADQYGFVVLFSTQAVYNAMTCSGHCIRYNDQNMSCSVVKIVT